MVLQKRAEKEQTESYAPGDSGGLTLQTNDGLELYQFPSEVVQAHRHMITRLMRQRAMVKRLSVVSALRGEGVTFSSLALATTLSHDFTQRVCYVDLNWWWPAPQLRTLHQQSQGIAALLNDHAALDTVLVKTGNGNLCLLPAGDLPPERRPVVARSDGLVEILAQLDEQFDTIILDIPAILATNDAIALAAQGNSCLLVIHQGVTHTASIKQALDDIATMPVTGTILNRMRIATPAWIRNWIPDL